MSGKVTSSIIKSEKPVDRSTNDSWSPARGKPNAYLGKIAKKPWEYACEVWIPVMDTTDTLPYVIELLRHQTKRPFIVLVDTGSTNNSFLSLEEVYQDQEDIELHRLRFKSVRHSSDYPAIAMDLAMSACRSDHLFCTHSDVFLKKQDAIERLIDLCDEFRPAVGYRMSPREHSDWERMVSHTCTMLHIPTMDRINAAWSLRKLCHRKGLEFVPNHPKMGNNWPDTEILLNYILWENNFTAKLIGTENNQERTNDEWIDHCRSLTAARLYSPETAKIRKQWVDDAIDKAIQRLDKWKQKNSLNS